MANEQDLHQHPALIPAGTIVAYGGTQSPNPRQWLLCDGKSYNASTDPLYRDLFRAIGTRYGGTGETNFNVPDMRGMFMRGAQLDKGNGGDPDWKSRMVQGVGNNENEPGSTQPDGIGAHNHKFTKTVVADSDSGTGYIASGGDKGTQSISKSESDSFGGNETRPMNISVNYLIKL